MASLISIRRRLVWLLAVLIPLGAVAQVGESEAALTKLYGEPVARAMENVMVKGKLLPSFPKLTYKMGERGFVCVFVEGICEKATNDQDGLWPEAEFARVLAENAQGMTWNDDPKTSKLRDVSRKWIRSDGATAHWRKNLGLTVTTAVYVAAEAKVKEEARNGIKILPKD